MQGAYGTDGSVGDATRVLGGGLRDLGAEGGEICLQLGPGGRCDEREAEEVRQAGGGCTGRHF
jgi:hypothetical protein